MLLAGLHSLLASPQPVSKAKVLAELASRGIHAVGVGGTSNLVPFTLQHIPVATKYILGAGVTAAITSTYLSEDRLKLAYNVPSRLARDVYTAAAIVFDYKLSLQGKEGVERLEALAECHQRGAHRLLHLCFANGGIYTKLGQHIGQLDHLLPEAYVATMRDNLLDKCPVSDYSEVQRIFAEEFGGRTPETMYASFDPKPIASASLAQVHVAKDFDGSKLAIKVQHAGLRETAAADIATIEVLVKAVRWIFPDFDYQWLVDEIKQNLPLELDFLHEASNAERCRENIESPRSRLGPSRVHVPYVDQSRSSVRVLTMEFVDGVGVTDVAALKGAGIAQSTVARLISETFAEMMFIHGDVHCDPHAANMLVRMKDGKPQLVLLDHGLYRRIDDEFRLEYAALWRSLIFADVEGINKHSAAMGAGHAVDLFASMLTQRPWDQVVERSMDHLIIPDSEEHREMLQRYAAENAREISDMFIKMPRPLLLLLKTNDCLRAVDKALGQTVNTFAITARECGRAFAEQQLQAKGVWKRLRTLFIVWEIELFIAVLHLRAIASRLAAPRQTDVQESLTKAF